MITHSWISYRNKTIFWLPMDTQELYYQNLKKSRDQLDRFGWIDRQIKYKFNSHGFRCDEFTNINNAVFLGCSHTAGVGLPVENTWPYFVIKELNLTCYNLAIGGGSNDLAFRISYHYLERLRPKMVFLLSPEPARIEVQSVHDTISFLPGNNDPTYYYKLYLSNEENLLLNQQKNIFAIENLCHRLDIKFVCIKEIHDIPDDQRDRARDLVHNGPKTNLYWSKKFLDKV